MQIAAILFRQDLTSSVALFLMKGLNDAKKKNLEVIFWMKGSWN